MSIEDHSLESVDLAPEIAVLVVTDGDGAGLAELIAKYRSVMDARPESYEFILLYNRNTAAVADLARDLAAEWDEFVNWPLRPWNGDDAALKLGIGRARADLVVTLAGWPEIEPEDIERLIEAARTSDVVIGRREDQSSTGLGGMRTRATHGLLALLFGRRFGDVFCRARAGRREVLAAVTDLGVRQHFVPAIAVSEGYDVTEVDVRPAPLPANQTVYRFKPTAHFGALFDAITLYVALNFLRRPLRFFGAVGMPLLLLGGLVTLFLVMERLFFGVALSDRPALVFSVMTMVLGVQIVALGLVGEIIVFSSSRSLQTYEVEKVLRGSFRSLRSRSSEVASDSAPEAPTPPEQDNRNPAE